MDNNIEQKIKEEFKNRTIKPNKKNWDTLESRLFLAVEKNKNKVLQYMTYAAVFIGLLFGFVLFLKKDTPTNKIIKTPKIVNVNKTNLPKKGVRNDNDYVLNKVVKSIKQKESSAINKTPIKALQNFGIATLNKKNIVALPSENKKNKKIMLPTIDVIEHDITRVNNNNRIKENVASKTKKEKLHSTDDEIDLLLADALNNSKENTHYELVVSSVSLQNEIPSNLKKPLKNKILNILKTGVDTVEGIIVSND